MLIWIVVISLCLHESRCSVVIDSLSQKGPHLSQYCAKSSHCQEGTHVMCMYFNPNRIMGPRCSNPQNITVTPELAANLLEVSNAVRSRIALGKEMGKNGALPRGYGIFRLSWDEELATFAQVLANQCVLTRDLCRATLKFSDPGQATGLVRFTYPEWLPVSNRSHFTTTNLTPAKLNYAITQTMKTWYGQKNYVTPEMIGNYPDFQNQKSQFGKLYLKMIYGPATHMGCGISAYTQFAYYDNNSPLNYNVVCNYSAKPRAGRQVFTTTPPTQVGFTIRCGCPEGFDEDLDCLCYESRKQPPTNPHETQNYCDDDSCKQSVVLLPIFTIEDAPPHKLLQSGLHNTSRRIERSHEIHHNNRSYMNVQSLEPQNLDEFKNILKDSDISRWTHRPKLSLTQRHYSDRKSANKKPAVRQSIFSRAPKFKLPTRKLLDSYRIAGNEIKKDVAPRKDFSAVQKLLKTYLNKKRNHAGNTIKGKNYEYTSNEPRKPKEIDVRVTDNGLVKKSKVANPNRFLNSHSKQHFVYKDVNTTKEINKLSMAPTNEYSDTKLMELLNNLESEVSRIELDPLEKKILDTRIRTIYDTVFRKNINHITPKLLLMNGKRHDEELNGNLVNYEKAADKEFINKLKFINEDPDGYKRNLYDDTGFVKRNQNSIRNENYRSGDMKYKHDGTSNNHFNAAFDATEDDHLSYDRRKYYQDKLDHLQRKLHEIRAGHSSSINTPRHVLPVRSSPRNSKEMQLAASQNTQLRVDTIFIPDRARFIHGF